MKLRELIVELQRIEAEHGGELVVDLGGNHPEHGFTTSEVELVDSENFLHESTILIWGSLFNELYEATP